MKCSKCGSENIELLEAYGKRKDSIIAIIIIILIIFLYIIIKYIPVNPENFQAMLNKMLFLEKLNFWIPFLPIVPLCFILAKKSYTKVICKDCRHSETLKK